MAKKPISLLLFKARRNLKNFNELVDAQSRSLKQWQTIRKQLGRHGMQDAVARLQFFWPGRYAKKSLIELKKHRRNAAKAVRHFEGHAFPKAKWDAGMVKKIKDHIKMTEAMIPKWKAAKVPESIIAEKVQNSKLYVQAKDRLIDRQINARGKGIRFIRRNGRIIPIRTKE